MSRKGRRVNFSPDVNDKPMSDFLKHSVSIRSAAAGPCSGRRRVAGIWSFRLPRESKQLYSPMEFFRELRAKVARAICLVSSKRRSSGKVSSSNLTRCRSVSDPIESHRAEALEDCIEFLNSSASLKRTNSVSSNY